MWGPTAPTSTKSSVAPRAEMCVVIEPRMAVSVDPTYTYRSFRPGAIETAWVMSMVCSGRHSGIRIQAGKLVPSVETPLIGTLLVCLAFLK